MPELSGVTSYVCHKCNHDGPQSPSPLAPSFNALQGLPGHHPESGPAQVSVMGGSASDPSISALVPVTITDNGAMVYQDSDLERLMEEANEQEREELVNWARDVVEEPLPSFNDFLPQFDGRMAVLGFVRDPSQELTPPDGDCALHAISAQVLIRACPCRLKA